MRLNKVFKILRLKGLQVIVNFMKQYAVLSYNTRSDICVITAGPNKTLSFQTSLTEGLVPVEDANNIRRTIGTNLLTHYGLPESEEEIPVVVLLITPSALVTIGKGCKKFIDDWVGESKVGELVVVKYRLN